MKKFVLTKTEIEYLRTLATKQAMIASLPIMDERKRRWTNMNDAVAGSRPVFAIESWTFDRDFIKENELKCNSEYGKQLEKNFLRHIRHHEILNDDHVCPDSIDISWRINLNEFGIDIRTDYIKDAEDIITGYHFHNPIKDLEVDGFDMIKPATFDFLYEETMAEKAQLEVYFGDILPVRIQYTATGMNCITQRLMRIMNMETFFIAMYDCPDKLHGLMRLLCDNALRYYKFMEENDLLILNNGNQQTCGTCYNFTSLLPKSGSEKVQLSDLWGVMDSQETVGIAPDAFNEFIFPYYCEIAQLFGLVYWGCCEPVHPIWESSISKLPNLKAVSISKWSNQEFMSEVLDNKGIVFSRKPDPNFLSVDVKFNEEGWRKEIANTINIVSKRNIPFELIVRDVYTLHGDVNNAKRATEIAMEEIEKVYT